MCRNGYDVNAEGYGGWTPLAEAVDYAQLENVKILLKYGANVNCVSRENVENLSDSRNNRNGCHYPGDIFPTRHYRITPLMDAVMNGFYEIAKVLMDNNADLRMIDSIGWTAYNHLENFIKDKGCDDDGLEFKEYLKNEMIQRNISLLPMDPSSRRSSSHVKLSDDIFETESQNDDDDDCTYIPSTSRIQKRPYSFENFENLPKRKPPSLSSKPPPLRQSPNDLSAI
ncbi:unnamed protein product [Caenorhabditis angaria]|uniref:ANK_REP_REGION domain-containing protein n=1 Tax=Caenorhabditis angaria TaxID=860376 RepID=A0A9P1I2Y5_9PELO|nr:unnamed protein product [Caenorhabditis angaria]